MTPLIVAAVTLAGWMTAGVLAALLLGRVIAQADEAVAYDEPEPPNVAASFDPLWWVEDTATVNGILVEMETEFLQ